MDNRIINSYCKEKVFFSEETYYLDEYLTSLVKEVGLVCDEQKYQKIKLSRYIYILGDQQEIYRDKEINFIDTIDEIFVYQDTYKTTDKGLVSCRVIVADLLEKNEAIRDSIFLLKLLYKSNNCFSILFSRTNLGCFISCKEFNSKGDTYLISYPLVCKNDFCEMADKLLCLPEEDIFVYYYLELIEAIKYEEECAESFDSKAIKKRGIQYSYLNSLMEIEKRYGMNLNFERSRYYHSLEENRREKYTNIIEEANLELAYIKSTKVNTLEMLFDAYEIEYMVDSIAAENDSIISDNAIHNDYLIDEDMKEYLDNPETLLKILKRGSSK